MLIKLRFCTKKQLSGDINRNRRAARWAAAAINTTDDGKSIPWQEFDWKAYVGVSNFGPGDDAYSRNKFNQLASDSLPPDRGRLDFAMECNE